VVILGVFYGVVIAIDLFLIIDVFRRKRIGDKESKLLQEKLDEMRLVLTSHFEESLFW
jgi:uncharacterized membrane-anchored protein YhcB (DUF1043 family)